jgi:hypothetical protein
MQPVASVSANDFERTARRDMWKDPASENLAVEEKQRTIEQDWRRYQDWLKKA